MNKMISVDLIRWTLHSNYSECIKIVRERKRPPRSPHKVKHSNRAKDCWIPIQTFDINNAAHSQMTG